MRWLTVKRSQLQYVWVSELNQLPQGLAFGSTYSGPLTLHQCPQLGSQKIPTKSVFFSYREKLIEQMKHHSIKWLSKHSLTFFGQSAGALGKWECLYIYGTWQSERLAANADIYLPHQTFTDEVQQRIYRESIWIYRSPLLNVYVSCCSSEGASID